MDEPSRPEGPRVSYRQQYRRCGKPTCPRCTDGAPGHGPYWYAYWWEDGKVRSRYVGKEAPAPTTNAALPAEPRSPMPSAAEPAPSVSAGGLRVRTLGAFAVWRDGSPLAPDQWTRRKKMTTLFHCLVTAPTHHLHRERLIDTLWPDGDPATGESNLRYTVHLLRKVLDQAGSGWSHLQAEGEFLLLIPAPMPLPDAAWLDAAAFLRAADAALDGTDPVAYQAALALYTGEYLPSEPYSDWATTRREELRRCYLTLLLRLAGLHIQRGQNAEAVEPLRKVLAADPCHEEAARLLIQALVTLGRRTEAAHTYRRLVAALRRDLNVKPDRETTLLYAALCAPDPAAASPDQPPPAARDTAPVQPVLDVLAPPADGAARAFVGREEEIRSLLHALAEARGGHGTLLLLGGPAGVGKSSLVGAFLRRTREAGALVLLGRAYRAEGQLPYGPLQDALRAFVAAQPASVLAAHAAYYAILSRLLPDLSRRLPSLPAPAILDARAERHRIFAALAGLLAELGKGQPVVLALEDLHWADDTTVEALHYLARTVREARVVIIATYRGDELAAGSLASFVTAREQRALSTMLTLGALAHEDVAALVAHLCTPPVVDEAVVTFVEARSRGNPLFAAELVTALLQTSRLQLVDGCWRLAPDMQVADAAYSLESLPVPARIQQLMRDRLGRLDSETRKVLALCAVLGQRLTYGVLHAAGAGTEDTLLDALEALLAAGVLEETPGQVPERLLHPEDALSYAFHHPLFREAVYASIPAQRRALLHARLGQVLEEWYGQESLTHAGELAWHFAHGHRFWQAARYAESAGDQAAAAWAGPAALAHYLLARSHLGRVRAEEHAASDLLDAERLSLLEEKIGGICLLTGDYTAAREAFAQARAAESRPARRADLQRKEGETWLRSGAYEQALAAFEAAAEEAALDPADTADSPSLPARIELGRGSVHYNRGDFTAASAAARRVLALLDSTQPAIAARAYQQLGNLATQQSDLERGEEWFRRALRLWEEQPEEQRDQQALANLWNGLGVIAVDRGDHAAAEDHHRRALAIRERIGDQAGIATSWNNLGVLAHDRGDLAAALLFYQRAIAIFERIGDQTNLGGLWNNLGDVLLAQGDLVQADHYQHLSLGQWERIGNQSGVGVCLMNLGAIALLRGDLDQAEGFYRRSLALMERIGMREYVAGVWSGLGDVALERGETAAAITMQRTARRIGVQIGNPAVLAGAALGAARAYLRADQPRAATAFRTAAQRLAVTHGLAGIAIQGLLLEAEQCLREERPPAAQTAAEAAIQRADQHGLGLGGAYGRYLLGLSLLATGAYAEARPHLEEALDRQTAAGAAPAARHTHRALDEARVGG